jgi:hypothetical protein
MRSPSKRKAVIERRQDTPEREIVSTKSATSRVTGAAEILR